MAKRMQLQLDDRTYDLLKELADISGISASALVTAMIQISRYDLVRLMTTIKSMGLHPSEVYGDVVRALERKSRFDEKPFTRRGQGSKGVKS